MLESLRQDVLNDRARLTSRNSLADGKNHADRSARATDGFNHNLALGKLSLERDAVFEIDAAICRILDGSYGTCEKTGKSIPAARLRVVPWTRYTKEVLERTESRGAATGTTPPVPASSRRSRPAEKSTNRKSSGPRGKRKRSKNKSNRFKRK